MVALSCGWFFCLTLVLDSWLPYLVVVLFYLVVVPLLLCGWKKTERERERVEGGSLACMRQSRLYVKVHGKIHTHFTIVPLSPVTGTKRKEG